jgi:RimJ/RimL family protein N-acetyltransferase
MKVPNTARLTFRLMDSGDADLLWQLDQDEEVMRFINNGIKTSMEDLHAVFLPRVARFTDQLKGWGLWHVSTLDTAEFLGWVLVRPMDFFTDEPKFNDLELGWRFFKKSWGKGYATEAATAIKTALIDNISASNSVDYLSATAIKENYGSIGVMKKIGMNFIKEFFHEDPLGDSDAVLYRMNVNSRNVA